MRRRGGRLSDFRRPAYFSLTRPHYAHESVPLSDDVRQSLLDDLELSDRDGLASEPRP